MDSAAPKKTCKMCCMEIPEPARKCPYCQQFQTFGAMWVLLGPVLLVMGAMVGTAAFSDHLFSEGKDFEKYSGQIVATESEIAFGESISGPTVAVIGTLKNTSGVSWKQVELHVDFLDAKNKRVDAGERRDFTYRVPAGGTSTFKVSFPREFPEPSYAKAVVRVAGAKDAKARF